jgi:ATP phosphoribosyltransferase
MPELTIAVAKGRLQRDTLELFARVGLRPHEIQESRCLAMEDESKRYQFIFVKSPDVPVYVEHGAADCGVVGRDVLLESQADLLQPLSLSIGGCQIVVAAPAWHKASDTKQLHSARSNEEPLQNSKEAILPKRDHTMLRVATKYPRIAARHFGTRGQPVEIIELEGSVELAPLLGLADCIVDLVETGRTLRENGLGIVEVIAESTARLVVNRASYQLKAKVVSELVAALRDDPRT